MQYQHTYIVTIQFLGFRFHGWQKQTNAKTVHEMVDKTLSFVLGNQNYKTLGVGRTDSKVSANRYVFQLFVDEEIGKTTFMADLNSNFPPDIKSMSMEKVTNDFNIIQHPKSKEYLYFFSFGEKNHPFAAPFIVGLEENLNIELMKQGAKLFEGEHFFHKYCTEPSENTLFKRIIDCCEIVENDIYTANFFPEKSYYLRVKGSGFLRYQIRLMMGVLFQLGKGEVDLEFIEQSLLATNDRKPLPTIAPSSGLQLYDVEINK
ncbi:tRNA pseudouridine(38-40) synthase TruA [Aureibaculum sp. 2210JD6-5]|uniref:tRNA pseudouridine(38-40) synthase TruA n=1 Tax=Aureibaculum sp. 2210JD6-5 TaxID=3103957 RepID=UPI002AAD3D07|nr:tRNA pseudouridine(38-40) synthase TruA [Aureibaculum sp. 2210JD6-5]MDY7396060.1 tRNA pseudouridine(38-40) synthase TruA [Aureibaculum sp. 2210JD6-5]